VGALRADNGNKKVFYVPMNETYEQLLYDFALSVGDTITGYLINVNELSCEYPVITSIDSIMLSDALYHKTFTFQATYCFGQLIEGIGSTLGLIEPLRTFEGGGDVMCFYNNGNLIYYLINESNCITSITTESIRSISITQNADEIRVLIPYQCVDIKIELYDLTGKCLMSDYYLDNDKMTFIINKIQLLPGIYILSVTSKQFNTINNFKIIKT